MLKIDLLKEKDRRLRKIAVLASLFVPGLGQFIRRRIAAGLFFIITFFLMIWFLTEIWKFNYGVIGTIMGLFIFYCLNIIDAYKGPVINEAPCTRECPSGINIPLYVSLIREGRFNDALEVIVDRMPFPSVCGRICYHPCETLCSLRQKGSSIAIESLKRAATDFGTATAPKIIGKNASKKTIAIIGAGPAGLSAAYFLARMSYPVTIFESAKTPGGMLLNTIPSYRLPKDTVEYDTERILATGIQLRTGITIGKDISFDELKKDYRAILLATGAQNAKMLEIQGTEKKGILFGIPFLMDSKIGKTNVSGKSVIVIGGGNVAIDCARSAVRLTANTVDLFCLETKDLNSKERMPAHEWEIKAAEHEGVRIHDQWGPKKIISKNGEVTAVEFVKCISVYQDETMRFSPKFDESERQQTDADFVIIAIGQQPDFSFLSPAIKQKILANNFIMVDHTTMETPLKGIFAAGDITDGGKTVVDAVEMGRKAATGIDWFMRRISRPRRAFEKFLNFDYEIPYKIPRKKTINGTRLKQNTISKKNALNSFSEVELGFTKEEAKKEASRCEQCNRKY